MKIKDSDDVLIPLWAIVGVLFVVMVITGA